MSDELLVCRASVSNYFGFSNDALQTHDKLKFVGLFQRRDASETQRSRAATNHSAAIASQLNAKGVRKFQPRVVSTLGSGRATAVNAEGVG